MWENKSLIVATPVGFRLTFSGFVFVPIITIVWVRGRHCLKTKYSMATYNFDADYVIEDSDQEVATE